MELVFEWQLHNVYTVYTSVKWAAKADIASKEQRKRESLEETGLQRPRMLAIRGKKW